MTKNELNHEVQYIWHDGVRIREDQLISMAKTARGYEEVKSYVMSLMAHGIIYGIHDYIYKVNEILKHHNALPFPVPDEMEHNEVHSKYKKSSADMAREKYQELDEENQYELLMNALWMLVDKHGKLVNKKVVWIGVFHVVHDRLDGSIVKSDFTEMAKAIEPANWPKDFSISDSTMANYSHYISYEDSAEAYYDMEDNPFDEFCNALWSILEPLILTSAYE